MVTHSSNRQLSQKKLRELMLQMSNSYGFLDRQFLADTGSSFCILEISEKTQKTGNDAGKLKWWILATAPNIDGTNETGYITFDKSPMRDRLFNALLADKDMLPAHNMFLDKVDIQGGKSYYDIKLAEDDNDTCPCTPYSPDALVAIGELENHPF